MTTPAKCPQCGKPLDISQPANYRPFCSERCKMIDLGEWASESYSIAGKPQMFDHSDKNDESSDY